MQVSQSAQSLPLPIARQFLETVPLSVAVFDSEVRYVYANLKWMQGYGIEGQDIIGKSHYEVFPEVPQRWRDIHQRCLNGETLKAVSDPFPRADGHTDYIDWEVQPWYSEDGEIGGIIMYTEVVTKSVLATTGIELSEQIAASLYDLTKQVSSATSYQSLTAVIADAFASPQRMSAVIALLREPDEHGNPTMLEMVGITDSTGEPLIPVGATYPLEQFPFTNAWMKATEPIVIYDVENSTMLDEATRAFNLEWNIRSVVFAPLYRGHDVVGVLNLNWFDEKYDVGVVQRAIIDALSSFVSPEVGQLLTIEEREHLLTQLSEREQVLAQRFALTQGVSAATNYQAIADAVYTVFGAQPNGSVLVALLRNDGIGSTQVIEVVGFRNAQHTFTVPIGTKYPVSQFPAVNVWMASTFPVLVPDVENSDLDAAAKAVNAQFGVKTLAYIPLRLGERVMGVIQINWRDELHTLTATEVETLLAATNIISPNVAQLLSLEERGRLVQQLTESESINKSLYELSRNLSGLTQYNQVADVLHRNFIYGDKHGVVSVALLRRNGVNQLEYIEVVGYSDGVSRRQLPVGTRYSIDDYPYIAQWLSADGDLVVNSTDDGNLPLVVRDAMRMQNIANQVHMPLYQAGQLFGAVTISWLNEPHAISTTEYGLITSIAGVVSAQVSQLVALDDQRRANQQLQAQELFLAQVIDIVPGLLAVKNRDGVYELVNHSFADFYDTIKENMIGKRDEDFVDDLEHIARFLRADSMVMDYMLPQMTDEEAVTSHKTGDTRYHRTVKVPLINDNGVADRVLLLATDIHDLREANRERELLIRQLEESLRFKDQFLSTMSHELRTPLNAIQGYAGIVLDEEDVDEDIAYMVTRIRDNSRRLLTLINDILDISRINADRVTIVQRPLDIRAAFKGWHTDFTPAAEKKNLNFLLELDERLPAELLGDEERLGQIVGNLLENAFKFTDAGSVTLRAISQDTQWRIEVADTGSGIPETWKYLIFDEFRQVDGSARRKFGGAGLGLSIVKKLAVLMGGNVSVETQMGEGSTFIVTLPMNVVNEEVSG